MCESWIYGTTHATFIVLAFVMENFRLLCVIVARFVVRIILSREYEKSWSLVQTYTFYIKVGKSSTRNLVHCEKLGAILEVRKYRKIFKTVRGSNLQCADLFRMFRARVCISGLQNAVLTEIEGLIWIFAVTMDQTVTENFDKGGTAH